MCKQFIGGFAAILLFPVLALGQYAGPNRSPHKGMSPASIALLQNALAGTGSQPIYVPTALGVQAADLQGPSTRPPAPARNPQPVFKIAMISDSPAVPTQPVAVSPPADATQRSGAPAESPDETYVVAGGYVDVMYAAHLLLDGGYASRTSNPLTGGRYPGSTYLARTYQVSPQSYWASDTYTPCGGLYSCGPYGYGYGYGYGCGGYLYAPPRFDGFGFYPLSGLGCGFNCGYGSYPFFSNFGTGFFPFNGVVINSGFRFSGNFTTGTGVFRVRLGL